MTQRPDGQPLRLTSRAGPALVALGASLWAVDLVLRQPLTGSLPSSAIVFYEHLVFSAVLVLPLWRSREKWRGMTRQQWLVTSWIALGGSALGTVCYTQAMRLSNPTSVVLLQKIQPLFAVLLAAEIASERCPTQLVHVEHGLSKRCRAAQKGSLSHEQTDLYARLLPVAENLELE